MTFQMCHVFLEKKDEPVFFPTAISSGSVFSTVITSGNLSPTVITNGNVFLTVITSWNMFSTVITSENVFPTVISGGNVFSTVISGWNALRMHLLEQIARAQAARRPSKEARRFLGRSTAKQLHLKTAIIMLQKK